MTQGSIPQINSQPQLQQSHAQFQSNNPLHYQLNHKMTTDEILRMHEANIILENRKKAELQQNRKLSIDEGLKKQEVNTLRKSLNLKN